jgi:hypothetical protein
LVDAYTDQLGDLVAHNVLYVAHNVVLWIFDFSKDEHLSALFHFSQGSTVTAIPRTICLISVP